MGRTAVWWRTGGETGCRAGGQLLPCPCLILSPSPKAVPQLPTALVVLAAQLGKKVAVVDYVEPSPRGR